MTVLGLLMEHMKLAVNHLHSVSTVLPRSLTATNRKLSIRKLANVISNGFFRQVLCIAKAKGMNITESICNSIRASGNIYHIH